MKHYYLSCPDCGAEVFISRFRCWVRFFLWLFEGEEALTCCGCDSHSKVIILAKRNDLT